MAKPKAITRAILLLEESAIVQIDRHGLVRGKYKAGRYRLVLDADARDTITSLKRADGRTRLDKTARANYRPPHKKTAK